MKVLWKKIVKNGWCEKWSEQGGEVWILDVVFPNPTPSPDDGRVCLVLDNMQG